MKLKNIAYLLGLVGLLGLILTYGEVARRYLDKDYGNKVQLRTWEARIEDFLLNEEVIDLDSINLEMDNHDF